MQIFTLQQVRTHRRRARGGGGGLNGPGSGRTRINTGGSVWGDVVGNLGRNRFSSFRPRLSCNIIPIKGDEARSLDGRWKYWSLNLNRRLKSPNRLVNDANGAKVGVSGAAQPPPVCCCAERQLSVRVDGSNIWNLWNLWWLQTRVPAAEARWRGGRRSVTSFTRVWAGTHQLQTQFYWSSMTGNPSIGAIKQQQGHFPLYHLQSNGSLERWSYCSIREHVCGSRKSTVAATYRQTFLYCVFMDSLYI